MWCISTKHLFWLPPLFPPSSSSQGAVSMSIVRNYVLILEFLPMPIPWKSLECSHILVYGILRPPTYRAISSIPRIFTILPYSPCPLYLRIHLELSYFGLRGVFNLHTNTFTLCPFPNVLCMCSFPYNLPLLLCVCHIPPYSLSPSLTPPLNGWSKMA